MPELTPAARGAAGPGHVTQAARIPAPAPWPHRRTILHATWACLVTGCTATGIGGVPGFYAHYVPAHPDLAAPPPAIEGAPA